MSAFRSLSLGPGRPHELERIMRAQDPSRPIQRLTDLAELLQCPAGRVLLDGAMLPAEDLGIIRRALQPGDRAITILGGDPSQGTLREVLKHPCADWLPYPPDSEELSQLIGTPIILATQDEVPAPAPQPRQHPEVTPEPTTEPMREAPEAPVKEERPKQEFAPQVTPPKDPNLAEIEAILSQPAAAFQAGEAIAEAPHEGDSAEQPFTEVRSEPVVAEEDPPLSEAESEPAIVEEEPQAPEPEDAAPKAEPQPDEPAWFKDQVADLADIVQTVYVSTSTMTEDDATAPPGLLADSMRLVQFTRTLGFLAAPPARGDTQFDLGELAEELLRSAGSAADAPRFLLKISDPLPVRGDKELIVQALDAVLVLARLCAGPEGEVRLSGQKNEEGGSALKLGFPRGPLDGLTPAEIVTPYALRADLPDMGKNALRAASRIIEGQGGAMTLSDRGGGQLQFVLTLPAP